LEEEQEEANNCQARQALTRVVASAYGLDFRVANQFSTVQALWESLKMMFQTGFPQPVPDSEWKRNTAKVRSCWHKIFGSVNVGFCNARISNYVVVDSKISMHVTSYRIHFVLDYTRFS
jgi:hypothetical protein